MKKPIGSYPGAFVRDDGRAVVSQAGSVLLVETVRKAGLDQAVSAALAPWRKPRTVHDPGKILVDLALAVALGGDCLADIAMLRAEPAPPVASGPKSPAGRHPRHAGEEALTTIRTARSEVRESASMLAGYWALDTGGQVIVDLDGVLVVSHSDKQDAAPTWKKTYGHHLLMGFADHGWLGLVNRSPLCSQRMRVCRLRPQPPASPSGRALVARAIKNRTVKNNGDISHVSCE